MNNVRRNAAVGIIETEGMSSPVTIHFSEWWNGEGIDFTIDREGGETVRFGLHLDEIHAIATAAAAIGMIETDRVQEAADHLNEQSEKRAARVRSFAKKYQAGDPF